jgi:hypothetical protein
MSDVIEHATIGGQAGASAAWESLLPATLDRAFLLRVGRKHERTELMLLIQDCSIKPLRSIR